MLSAVLRPLLNFSERFVPYTEHPGWKPLSALSGLILAIVAALNIPEVRPVASGILLALLVLLLVAFFLGRYWPTSLRKPWVLVCMRHHSALFERLFISSAVANLLATDRKLILSSYKKGSIIDCLQDERAEHTLRQPHGAGYFVTFDAERAQRLLQDNLEIGTAKYQLCRLSDLGIGDFLRGYQLHEALTTITTPVMQHARPLFWGLSGVAVKHRQNPAIVGGYALPQRGDSTAVCLTTLIQDIGSGTGPDCPVVVLNWPVLLFNLLAIAKFNTNDVNSASEIDETKKALADLRNLALEKKLEVIESPVALMERFRTENEIVVIGGGTWLPLQDFPHARVHPIAKPSEPERPRAYVQYMECFGVLRPAENATSSDRDVKTIDRWLAEQVILLVEGARANDLTLVGAACWHRIGKRPPPLAGIADETAQIFYRRSYLNQDLDTYTVFEA